MGSTNLSLPPLFLKGKKGPLLLACWVPTVGVGWRSGWAMSPPVAPVDPPRNVSGCFLTSAFTLHAATVCDLIWVASATNCRATERVVDSVAMEWGVGQKGRGQRRRQFQWQQYLLTPSGPGFPNMDSIERVPEISRASGPAQAFLGQGNKCFLTARRSQKAESPLQGTACSAFRV